MDIHKPKPWHGLREFLKEYVIIVVGVLTALGAEQVVEALRWQERVEAAETQIRRELSLSWAIAGERLEATPCLDRRLAALEDRLLAPGTAWTPLPPMVHPEWGPAAYETPFRNWPSEVWRSLAADGTTGHLQRDRQLRLGCTYIQIAQLAAANQQEDVEIGELNLLGRPLELDRTQRLVLARSIERERWRVKNMASLAKQLHDRVPKMITVVKTPGDVIANSGTLKACSALGLLAPPPNAEQGH